VTGNLPVLRAPPFPWADATVSVSGETGGTSADAASLFALVRDARVGGRFWAAPSGLVRPAGVVLKPRDPSEIDAMRCRDAVWILPSRNRRWSRKLIDEEWREDVDPWTVLPGAGRLVAHGDDEWIVLARTLGVPVEVLSSGRFGRPHDDDATLDRLAALALSGASWRDPFTGLASNVEAVVGLLATWRRSLDTNRAIVAACGMAWWKRKEIRRFLWHPGRSLAIVSSAMKALRIARKARRGGDGAVAIWPSRVSPALLAAADRDAVPLVRVEDGFVRSVGLGVDLVPPSSIVVDVSGIHFDPRTPSDLESILDDAEIAPPLIERAAMLRKAIISAGISKYSAETGLAILPARLPGKRLVLVPGQVEDDMSVLAGGGGLTSNLELVRRARTLEPDAEIWFRPHPDVDAGHRRGAVPDSEILKHADRIARGGGMAPLLDAVDAVHVLTSLTGFEALMRGREVTCHGTPFYAGWGLTRDLGEVPARRTRKLPLDALVAGVLILYPRYLDPVTGLPCPPEVLVGRMAARKATNRLRWIMPLRRWQGKLMGIFR
jgi:capsular polysaccharide export protein